MSFFGLTTFDTLAILVAAASNFSLYWGYRRLKARFQNPQNPKPYPASPASSEDQQGQSQDQEGSSGMLDRMRQGDS